MEVDEFYFCAILSQYLLLKIYLFSFNSRVCFSQHLVYADRAIAVGHTSLIILVISFQYYDFLNTESLDEITLALFLQLHFFVTEISINGVSSSQRILTTVTPLSNKVTEYPFPFDNKHASYTPTNILIIFTVECTMNRCQTTACSLAWIWIIFSERSLISIQNAQKQNTFYRRRTCKAYDHL